jgi:hypothetical protein
VALAALLLVTPARADVPRPVAPAAGRWRDASLDEYRKHLMTLTTLVDACAKARDLKTCDPLLVGPDDRIPLNGERRLVRYGWLRVLFSKAEEADEPAPRSAHDAKGQTSRTAAQPTTSQLLQDAEKRLAGDLALVDAFSSAVSAHNPQHIPTPQHVQEHETMRQVLAGRDFRNVMAPSMREAATEKLGNWLNRLFESASQLRARSAWVGRAIVWGFILAICVGLAWGLLQLERRWRVRLVPEAGGSAARAASARDWQLWLRDAQAAAAAGNFREAVHFVYWAAIARLESQRLWPADRARTPREYLALVASADPRKAGLVRLTASFERIWYGGRAAGENDYRQAEQLAITLIAGGKASLTGAGVAQAVEGGSV